MKKVLAEIVPFAFLFMCVSLFVGGIFYCFWSDEHTELPSWQYQEIQNWEKDGPKTRDEVAKRLANHDGKLIQWDYSYIRDAHEEDCKASWRESIAKSVQR